MTSETKAVPTLGEQIATLKELLAKATPGDWEYVTGDNDYDVGVYGPSHSDELIAELTSPFAMKLRAARGIKTPDVANAALIVAMKNTLPALIARVEEVERDLEFCARWAASKPDTADAEARSIIANSPAVQEIVARWNRAALKGPAA